SRQISLARLNGYVFRQYAEKNTSNVLSVLLVWGPAGPVSIHTPDDCYPAAGYEMLAKPIRTTLSCEQLGEQAELFTAKFRRQDIAAPQPLRIYWTWS